VNTPWIGLSVGVVGCYVIVGLILFAHFDVGCRCGPEEKCERCGRYLSFWKMLVIWPLFLCWYDEERAESCVWFYSRRLMC